MHATSQAAALMLSLTRIAASPRVILTYGRFDMFDQDHVSFLRRISLMGNELIVGCATDEHAQELGLPCQMPYRKRRALLESCRFVSRVIAETDVDQKRTDIVNYNVCALVMGHEHTGQHDELHDIAQVLYKPRSGAEKRFMNSAKRLTLAAVG